VVLEDIYQPHNASAVLRSCDCFGIQDIHIIENKNKYNINPDIALGSSKWVNIIKYNQKENNTEECLKSLKKKGYRILATMPDENYRSIEDYKPDRKTALIFGTEMDGLSDAAINLADECVRIKMYGFTESLNISVSAAICIHYLSAALRNSAVDWRLTDGEMIETKLSWVRNIVKSPDLLEKEFFKNYK
jgi:tRNA (guanosine-2'-O-)-methyltransferase